MDKPTTPNESDLNDEPMLANVETLEAKAKEGAEAIQQGLTPEQAKDHVDTSGVANQEDGGHQSIPVGFDQQVISFSVPPNTQVELQDPQGKVLARHQTKDEKGNFTYRTDASVLIPGNYRLVKLN